MVKIKDLEEKKCIMAYYKCHNDKSRKKLFSNSSIYNKWCRWWGMDFPKKENGKPMQIYRNQFVLSVAKPRKGITSEKHNECTKVLSSITKWINDNYDSSVSRKVNRNRFHDMLVQVREENYAQLIRLLSDNGLTDEGYSLHDTSPDNIFYLSNYCLICNGETVINGSYETILEYLITMDIKECGSSDIIQMKTDIVLTDKAGKVINVKTPEPEYLCEIFGKI